MTRAVVIRLLLRLVLQALPPNGVRHVLVFSRLMRLRRSRRQMPAPSVQDVVPVRMLPVDRARNCAHGFWSCELCGWVGGCRYGSLDVSWERQRAEMTDRQAIEFKVAIEASK